MNRQNLWTLTLFAPAMLAPCAVHGASANSVTLQGTAQASVIQPAAITRIEDLRFGQFFQPVANGNLTVDVNGTVTPVAGMVGLIGTTQTGTGRGPARFLIEGDPNRAFTVTLPNRIDIAKGTDTIRVQNFTTNVPNPRGNLGTAGQFMLMVGARLQPRANQPVGTYSGTFTVTVAYQ